MTQEFDFNKALEQLQSGKALTGEDGVLTPLIKQLTEASLKAELNLSTSIQRLNLIAKMAVARRRLNQVLVSLN